MTKKKQLFRVYTKNPNAGPNDNPYGCVIVAASTIRGAMLVYRKYYKTNYNIQFVRPDSV